MNEERMTKFVLKLGLAIDEIAKECGRLSTVEIATALAQIAASAAVLCNPTFPPAGIELVYNEFVNHIGVNCERKGIKGVRIVTIGGPPKARC